MYEIQVERMTCGGCASRVTKAVLSLDEDAEVNVDLKSKLVRITSTSESTELVKAISGAGYPARLANGTA
jgi:copper chaperone